MAAIDSSYPSSPLRSPVNMPKLLYRNPSTTSSAPSTLKSQDSLSLNSTSSASTLSVPTSPVGFPISPSPVSPTVPTVRFNRPPPTGSSPLKPQMQQQLTPADAGNQPKAKKSKASSFRNFFGAKEPSTQAWLDYQSTLRKQQAAHNGRSVAVGLPMVSTAKLPANVPKVNSKWDGVPEALKQKQKASKRQGSIADARSPTSPAFTGTSLRKFSTHSTRSSETCGSRNSSILSSSPGFFTTRGKVNTDDLTRNLTRVGLDGHGNNSSPSTSTASLPEITPNFYLDMPVRGNYPVAIHEIERRESDVKRGAPSLSMSPGLTPLELSPMTPPASSPFIPTGLSGPIPTTKFGASDIQTTVLTLTPADKVILNSSGPHILGPPVSALRKAKHTLSPDGEVQSGNKPAFELKSILKREATLVRPSLSEYFPRMGNAVKPPPSSSFSRDRNVAPWESPESAEDADNSERVLTPTPQGSLGRARSSRKHLLN